MIINDIFGVDDSRLPSAYQQVEYLKCTTTNGLLNTEWRPKKSGFEITVKIKNDTISSTNGYLFGTGASTRMNLRKNSNSHTYNLYCNNSSGSSQTVFSNITLSESDFHTIKIRAELSKIDVWIDGVQIVTQATFNPNEDFNRDFYLFGSTTSGNAKNTYISEFSAKNDEDAKGVEYYACYKKSGNVLGFYDVIGETFKEPTQGTFVKGADAGTKKIGKSQILIGGN